MNKFFLFALFLVTNIANAGISNVVCDAETNTITFNHNGIYNHAWVYKNAKLDGDFWTISSGSDNYVTKIEPGDRIFILFYNKTEDYGSTDSVECY